jgi:hypothetical protein
MPNENPASPAEAPASAPVESRWLLAVAQFPQEDPGTRMKILRTLDALGAGVLREGVFLFPDSPDNRQALDRLAAYLQKSAGTMHVIHALAATPAQQASFRSMFDRSSRYEDLSKTVRSLKVGFGVADPGAISRVLHKQRREFESISALDFFPSASHEAAKSILAEAEAEVRALIFPTQAAAGLAPGEKLLQRTWATRRPPWADRLACAWLIRRFVDPEGSVVWLEKTQPCPPDAIGFSFDGAHFGNSETRVTFEEMLVKLDLAKNTALVKIGGIVHYLEVKGTPVAEAAGVQTLLQGAARRSNSDDELLHEAEKTFDLLYEAYFDPANS